MEEQNEQTIKPVQSPKNIWTIIISIIVTAFIVGGGVYTWQKSHIKNTEQELQQQIYILQDQIIQYQQQINSNQNELSAKQPQGNSVTDQKQNTNVTCNNPQITECAKEGENCQSFGQGVGGGDNCLVGLKCDGSGPDGTTGKCIKSGPTENWIFYTNIQEKYSIQYPNDGTYSIETPEANHIIITQEHPGNRIHIRTQDSDGVEGAFFTANKTINNQIFRQFNYEGEGSGYGYMIENNGKNYIFESDWGPTNDIFELIMTTLLFQ